MKPESKLGVIGHNVVIDNGTATVKGGFSTADTPQCRIPTLVGHGRHKVGDVDMSISWNSRITGLTNLKELFCQLESKIKDFKDSIRRLNSSSPIIVFSGFVFPKI